MGKPGSTRPKHPRRGLKISTLRDGLERQYKYNGENQPSKILHAKAKLWRTDVTDLHFARKMDEQDPFRHFRDQFLIPKKVDLPSVDKDLVSDEEDCIYFCSHSLGLQPKSARHRMEVEFDKWAKLGAEAWANGDPSWLNYDEKIQAHNAVLAGARTEEVVMMNSLTVNLHFLMISFYRPTEKRYKILIEQKAFPSDHYMVESQIKLHGYDPKTAMICVKPRRGEFSLRTTDIQEVIAREGDSIAVILFPGVQSFTGQKFDLQKITEAGHAKGCYVGFDLAHAIGNVEIQLHEWDVDFAVWATNKYLNGGPGGIGGAFVHNKFNDANLPKLHGWWSHDISSRFKMDNKFVPSPGVSSYRVSTPPAMLCALVQSSMEVFMGTSMAKLCTKSQLLTGYLELLLKHYLTPSDTHQTGQPGVEIITPGDVNSRGCTLSIYLPGSATRVYGHLARRGVVVDVREPNIMRISPVPLYNTFEDIHHFIQLLREAIEETS